MANFQTYKSIYLILAPEVSSVEYVFPRMRRARQNHGVSLCGECQLRQGKILLLY